MAALPNLSGLSLDAHDADATGAGGEQCDPTKSRGKGRCVRLRLHPRVFESVRGRIDPKKYDVDSTSICVLAPLPITQSNSGRDQRYYTKSIEQVLYKSLQWTTFRNKYLYKNPNDQRGDGRFEWGSDIKIRPGFYGAYGWQAFPESERENTWEYLFVKYGLQAPRSELRGRYEPDLFGAELCMEPDWDLELNPEHTVAFIEALYDYNVDHFAYWVKKYLEEKEARAEAATQRKHAREARGAEGHSSDNGNGGPAQVPNPSARQQLNQDARAEKLRRREQAQQRLAAEARRRRAASPALEVQAEPVPMTPLRPEPESPRMPSNNQAETWLRELEEAQGGASPAPAPQRPELPEDPNEEMMDEILRDMRDNPDAYARMFS